MPRIELIHPMLVHFPIALFFAALAFELMYQVTKNRIFQNLTLGNLTLASIGALAAAIFGEVSENIIPHNEQIHQLMQTHELIGWITVGLFTVLTIWGYLHRFRDWSQTKIIYWALLLISAGVITYGATLGGTMVFEQGAAVKPLYEQLRQAEDGHEHTHGTSEEQSEGDHSSTEAQQEEHHEDGQAGMNSDTSSETHEHQDNHTH